MPETPAAPSGRGRRGDVRLSYPDGGTKTRACPVLHEDPETGELIVVYGTSSLGLRGHPDHKLILREPCALAQAGLHRPTRFQLDRRIRVAPDDPRFCVSHKIGTARLGRLPAWLRLHLPERHARQHGRSVERSGIHPALGRTPSRVGRHAPFRQRRPQFAETRATLQARP